MHAAPPPDNPTPLPMGRRAIVDRQQVARIAALAKWARTDPVEGTAAARAAFLASFEAKADPDGTLDPAERARRAELLRKEHFARMARRSAQARSARAAAGAAS